MKKILTAVSMALAISLPTAAKTNLVELDKELEIMSSILHTALKQNRDSEGVRYRSLKAKYLAKQGVVFEVNSSNRISHPGFDFDFNFGFGDGARFVIPDAPDPIDVHEIERQVEEAMEHVNEQDWGRNCFRCVRKLKRSDVESEGSSCVV